MENNQLATFKPTGNFSLDLFNPSFFNTMQSICKMYASSELVPDMYQISEKNPESKAIGNCMIALEVASRIGASPLMVMQNMVPIYGRPSWSSKFLIATVNTCGRFNALKFKFENLGKVGKIKYTDYVWNPQTRKKDAVVREFDGTNLDNWQCTAYTTAKSDDEILEGAPVSIALAIQEGWYTKNGSKWVTMTRQMLTYRAASFWTSAYAPELSMGMKTVEEHEDIIDITHEVITTESQVKEEINDKGNKKPVDVSQVPSSPEPNKEPMQTPPPPPEEKKPEQPKMPGF